MCPAAGKQAPFYLVPSQENSLQVSWVTLFLCSCKLSYSIAQRTQAFGKTLSAFHYLSSIFSSQFCFLSVEGRCPLEHPSALSRVMAALPGNVLSSCEHFLWFASGDTGSQGNPAAWMDALHPPIQRVPCGSSPCPSLILRGWPIKFCLDYPASETCTAGEDATVEVAVPASCQECVLHSIASIESVLFGSAVLHSRFIWLGS